MEGGREPGRESESEMLLTLQFEKVGAFLVHIRPLGLQHLVEALALQAAAGHGEVDEGHTRAEVWWELNLNHTNTEEANHKKCNDNSKD